ncbi:hypothetical protein JDV02_004377 [Purpureocillium takamizusanense]|uniref:Uncharacterized protein n=1 Tax=Purpureocillium takamizusanense TaxID=2060973 RepID=A0A9Q8QF62_9HYPO|nr:uncharacterized protein JDV02_004377 [Purpureocillium takamizusanense]UNI18086.1 hypothetical protein JDV02_004377 [Purpureocillium takamizusanense]
MPRPVGRPRAAKGPKPTDAETNAPAGLSTRQTRSRALKTAAAMGREDATATAEKKRALNDGSPGQPPKRPARRGTRIRTKVAAPNSSINNNDGSATEAEEDEEAPQNHNFYNKINVSAGVTRSQEPQKKPSLASQQSLEEHEDLYAHLVDFLSDDNPEGPAAKRSGLQQKTRSPELGANGSSSEPPDRLNEKLDRDESPEQKQHDVETGLGAKDIPTRVAERVTITTNVADTAEGAVDAEGPEVQPSIVSLEKLSLMLKLMAKRGWTGDNDYADELLPHGHERGTNWLKRHAKELGTKDLRALFQMTYELIRILKRIPRIPKYQQQAGHLRAEKETIKTALEAVGRATARVTDPRLQLTKAARTGICKKVMPMLVLCLREAVLVGTLVTSDAGVPLPVEGLLIPSALELPRLVLAWCLQLYMVLEPQLDENRIQAATKNEKMTLTNRRRIKTYLGDLLHKLKQADDPLNQRLHRQMATQMQQETRRIREKEARDERDKQERQMQLVREASQRILIEDKYLRDHGWRIWEDEALRDTLDKVSNPKIETLVGLVPGRTEYEVRRRVAELREMAGA